MVEIIERKVDETTLKSIRKLDQTYTTGLRVLLLGMHPQTYIEGFTIKKVLLHIFLFLFMSGYALYYAIGAFVLKLELIELLNHMYDAFSNICLHLQWLAIIMHLNNIYDNEVHIEDFHSTQLYPEVARGILEGKAVPFYKAYKVVCVTIGLNSFSYILGPTVDALIRYFVEGELGELYILPPLPGTPWWGEIILYFANAIMMILILIYCTMSFNFMSIHAIKISTQAEVLNEALEKDRNVKERIKLYIKDHINLMTKSKALSGTMSAVNTYCLISTVLLLSLQLYCLTMVDKTPAYIITLMMDFMTTLSLLAVQCWAASVITYALTSIADGAYMSPWYEKDKDFSLDVSIMAEVARREHVPKVWFHSIKIERATIINVVRSAYSFYTMLLVLQEQKP